MCQAVDSADRTWFLLPRHLQDMQKPASDGKPGSFCEEQESGHLACHFKDWTPMLLLRRGVGKSIASWAAFIFLTDDDQRPIQLLSLNLYKELIRHWSTTAETQNVCHTVPANQGVPVRNKNQEGLDVCQSSWVPKKRWYRKEDTTARNLLTTTPHTRHHTVDMSCFILFHVLCLSLWLRE